MQMLGLCTSILVHCSLQFQTTTWHLCDSTMAVDYTNTAIFFMLQLDYDKVKFEQGEVV